MEKETKTPRTTIARIDLSEEDCDLNVSVVISWGGSYMMESLAQEDPIEYLFATKKEAKAFLAGVSDAIEWSSFKLVQDVTVDYEEGED